MRRLRSSGDRPVVIIGSGVAGVATAASLRSSGYGARVILVSEECVLPYRRSLLPTSYLRGEVSREELLIHPAEWYREARVDLLLGARAIRIDRRERTLEVRGHGAIPYRRLVLATGVREDIPLGIRAAYGVGSIRAVDALRAAAERARSAIVVGVGRMASEVTCSLTMLGLGVTLLAPEDLVGPVALGAGRCKIAVTTAAGVTLRADLIVRALRGRPDSELASDTGLSSTEGGPMDPVGMTIDPAIFATGGLLGITDETTAEAHARSVACALMGMDVMPAIDGWPPDPAGATG